jgi:hypothetical protein
MAKKDIMGYQKPRGKKTNQGCSKNSKGTKKYRGQGGSRKRVRQTCKPGRQQSKT